MKKQVIGAAVVATAFASSASASLLWNNGPLTSPGSHPSGADWSLLESNTLGMNTLGANASMPTFAMADNFTVGAGGWSLDGAQFYAYQTGSGLQSTFTGIYVQIWDASPAAGGQVIWGNETDNLIAGTDWTGAYRVSEGAPSGTSRPIMYVDAGLGGVSLAEGEYWISVSFEGSLSSGPWAPPIVIPGETTTGTALQRTSTGWGDWLDSGTQTQQGLPFLLFGSAVPAPGALALLGLAGLVGVRRRRA